MFLRYGIAVLFMCFVTGAALAEESSGDTPAAENTGSSEVAEAAQSDSPGQDADPKAPDTTATEQSSQTTEPTSQTTDPQRVNKAPESYDAAAVRCPTGCVPAASVPDVTSAPDIRNCPRGCVAVEAVKWQRDMRRGTAGGEEKSPPVLPPIGAQPNAPTVEDAPEVVRASVHDAYNRRIVLGPTAMEGIAGQLSLDVHELQVLELQYSLNRNLQLGVIMTIPVVGLGGFGSFRCNFAVSDNVFLGFGAFGGGISTVASHMTNLSKYFAGGHAGISASTSGGTVFNMGAIFSAVVFQQFNGDHLVSFLPVPYMGVSVPVSPKWSFVGELFLPITSMINREDPDMFDFGSPFLLFYGARFSTKRVYGNMGFFIPMNSFLIKFLRYCPPGFPYLSFGIRI